MASSPFAPDGLVPAPVVDTLDPAAGGTAPADDRESLEKRRLRAALSALGSLAMFAPLGKGMKAIAGAAGIGGGLALGDYLMGPAQAQGGKGMKIEPPTDGFDDLKIPVSDRGREGLKAAELGPMPKEIQDKFTVQYRTLQNQLKIWEAQLLKGGVPKPETQKQVTELTRQINEIDDKRAKIDKDERDKTSAQESAARRQNYQLYGAAGGLGLAGLVSLGSMLKLRKAVKGFENNATHIDGLTKTPGNMLLSQGNVAQDMQAGINRAYTAGGAREPLPSLAHVYGAENKTQLSAAKKYFRNAEPLPIQPGAPKRSFSDRLFNREGAGVPSTAPFSATNADKVSKLHPVIEKGLPAAAYGEAGLAYGASLGTDNQAKKDELQDYAWMGGAGGTTYLMGRKAGKMLANKRPTELAMRAVNAGRERLQRDVQTVGVKDIQTYSKNQNALATSGLENPLHPKKGKFAPINSPEQAAYLRGLNQSKKEKQQLFASTQATRDERVLAAHAASIKDGKVDPVAFRKALRKAIGSDIEHNGKFVKVDDNLVKEILKALEKLNP